jgi:hypothetical protein
MLKLFKLNMFSNYTTIQNYFGFFNGYKVMQATRKFDNSNNSFYPKFLNCIIIFLNPGGLQVHPLHPSRGAHACKYYVQLN